MSDHAQDLHQKCLELNSINRVFLRCPDAICPKQHNRKGGIISKPFALVVVLLLFSSVGFAEDLFIAQNSTGNGYGTNCSNTLPLYFFNNAVNWGSGAGKISPGDTVHLCGTITGTAGTNGLTTKGSGTSGNVITVKFEPGAIMSAPSWGTNDGTNPTGGALTIAHQYITVDGNHTGIIQNTLNGTLGEACLDGTCTLKNITALVYIVNTSHVVVKNLTLTHSYVRTLCSTEHTPVAYPVFVRPTVDVAMTDITIHGNSVNHGTNLIVLSSGGRSSMSALTISGNTLIQSGAHIVAAASSSGRITNLTITGNDVADSSRWWDNVSHLNGMHLWASNTGASLENVIVSNNYVHGDFGGATCGGGGANTTALIFLESTGGGTQTNTQVFNNVLVSGTNDSPSNGLLSVGDGNSTNTSIYNNTLVGSGGICLLLTGTYTAKNNICQGTAYAEYLNGGGQSQILGSANNVFYNTIGFKIGVSNYSFEQWRALGFDVNSVNGQNPNLAMNYHLNSGSPAVGAGENLSSLGVTTLNMDKDMLARPVSGAWDAGAFAFGALFKPNPPVGLRVQ